MTYFLASDVHLRLDRPERARSFASFVAQLSTRDTLIVAGDLCDFWFCTRQADAADRCMGLHALRNFRREGGELIVLVGNHDRWMAPYYRRVLDARCVPEPFLFEASETRVQVVHGHQAASPFDWKRLLETRLFFLLFSWLPATIANRLETALMGEKDRKFDTKNKRLMVAFRRYVLAHSGEADLFVFGHVHQRADEQLEQQRLIVLGDWSNEGGVLTIDEQGPQLRQVTR